MTRFFDAIIHDHRIGLRHIVVYLDFVKQMDECSLTGSVQITRKKVMQLSKIRNIATYHKCMKELQEFGYIDYQPSYHPLKGSLAHFQVSQDYPSD